MTKPPSNPPSKQLSDLIAMRSAVIILTCGLVAAWAPLASAEPLPSLDELLGLSDNADSSPDDQHARDLDRKLTAQDAADALNQALVLMDDSANRLANPGGTGLVTQRLQEDIIRKLDTVIEAAKQNQGSGSGSSAGSKAQQQPQQSKPGSQKSGAQSMPGKGESNAESMPAPGGPASPATQQQLLDASAWGALPDRLRNALQQGLSDKFSATYRSLTEAYYRRLAEEAENDQ